MMTNYQFPFFLFDIASPLNLPDNPQRHAPKILIAQRKSIGFTLFFSEQGDRSREDVIEQLFDVSTARLVDF